jgi:hypothetical protein
MVYLVEDICNFDNYFFDLLKWTYRHILNWRLLGIINKLKMLKNEVIISFFVVDIITLSFNLVDLIFSSSAFNTKVEL